MPPTARALSPAASPRGALELARLLAPEGPLLGAGEGQRGDGGGRVGWQGRSLCPTVGGGTASAMPCRRWGMARSLVSRAELPRAMR
jgi:hypothetical protein